MQMFFNIRGVESGGTKEVFEQIIQVRLYIVLTLFILRIIQLFFKGYIKIIVMKSRVIGLN